MFADVFTQLLEERNLSAYRLAKDINKSESLVSEWKSGKKLPGYNNLKVLADYFGVSVDYLLERTSNSDVRK